MGSELGSGEWGVGRADRGGGNKSPWRRNQQIPTSHSPLPTPHSPLSSFLHSQKAERFGHMVVVAVGRLPRDAFAVGGRALESVEVDSQFLAGLGLSFIDLVNRDAHLAVPDFLIGRDAGLHFKARIPLPVVVAPGGRSE